MKFLKHFIFLVLTVGAAAAISLIGGIGLEIVSKDIALIIPLLVSVPSLNNLAGDYAAISAAHVADPKETPESLRDVRRAVNWALLLNVGGIVIISSVIAALRGFALEPVFLVKFALFVGLSVWAVVVGIFWFNRVLNRLLKNHRLNADDILIPVGTALADIVMLGLVALATKIVF